MLSASAAGALMLVAAQDALAQKPAPDAPATVQIIDASGRTAGAAQVWNGPDGVLIRIEVRSLTPDWHGVHVHETRLTSRARARTSGIDATRLTGSWPRTDRRLAIFTNFLPTVGGMSSASFSPTDLR